MNNVFGTRRLKIWMIETQHLIEFYNMTRGTRLPSHLLLSDPGTEVNPPDDARLVNVAYWDSHAAFALTFQSKEFDMVIPGGMIPIETSSLRMSLINIEEYWEGKKSLPVKVADDPKE